MFNLKPKKGRFFKQFEDAADLMVQTAEQFNEFLGHFENPDRYSAKIRELEHKADQVVHDTMNLLHKTFITPLERGDIRRLIKEIDSVVDHIDSCMSRINIYKVTKPLPQVKEMGSLILAAAREIRLAVGQLRNLTKGTPIMKHCQEINRIENNGDDIFLSILAKLFESETNPLLVIKWKEIIEDMESALDCCEDVANVIEGVVVEFG